MTFLERRRYGGKTPSPFVGMLLGIYIAMIAVMVMPLVATATDNQLCQGNYACFSSRACQKSSGEYIECRDKCGSGRGFCYAPNPPTTLSIRIGSLTEVVDVGQYVAAAYTYAIGVAAILAAVMMMIGGVQWLTSAGDAGKVSSAKTRITNAIIGLMLTLCAWVFLNTINPSLVSLQMPRIPMVRPKSLVDCNEFKMKVACGQEFSLAEKQNPPANATAVTDKYEVVARDHVDAETDCVGASCTRAGSEDGTNTCQSGSGATGEQPSTAPGETISAPVSPYQCLACTAHGQTCTGIGYNSACCGQYCGFGGDSAGVGDELARWFGSTASNMAGVSGTCHNGVHGTLCADAGECIGARCVDLTRWGALMDWRTWIPGSSPILSLAAGGICMNGSTGAPCNSEADCAGLACVEGAGKNYCTPKVVGAFCVDSSDCPSGNPCQTTKGFNVCAGAQPSCCSQPSESDGTCRGDKNHEFCARYGEGYRCISVQHRYICSNGAPGTQCTEDAQCEHQNCYTGAIMDAGIDVGICVEGVDGNGCDRPDDCQSGVCFNSDGVGRICIGPNPAGGPCIPGQGDRGGCATGLTCHESSHTCI